MKTTVLCAYWRSRAMTCRQYADALKKYVASLQKLSPAFHQMYVLGTSRASSQRLMPSFENLEQLILETLPKDLSYLSAEGKRVPPGPDCFTRNGFMNTLATTLDYETPGADVETTVGSIDADSTSNLVVRLRGPELTDRPALQEVFKVSVACWEPAYAYVEVEAPGAGPNDGLLDEIPLGWLTYVADPRLPTALPQEILSERFGAGAIVEVPGGDAPDRDGYVSRLEELRRTLRSAGLLDDPLAS